jgi:fructoselysine-6-P-deglycase FrlB-like protein
MKEDIVVNGSTVEQDIRSTPHVWDETLRRVEEQTQRVSMLFGSPAVFLGSGSSLDVGMVGASLYEVMSGVPAQAILPSEYRPRAGWLHVAISRTGKTSELLDAIGLAKEAGAPVLLIVGEPDSPATELADVVLPLEFAPEAGIIQTRFITSVMLALRHLLCPDDRAALHALPAALTDRLQGDAILPPIAARDVVFLGRDWRWGMAISASLTVQETALRVATAYQTLDYRHGPIATISPETLLWCFDPVEDAVSADVVNEAAAQGAQVRRTEGDPLIDLVGAQLLAVRLAERDGVDPDAPRNLSRFVELPPAR